MLCVNISGIPNLTFLVSLGRSAAEGSLGACLQPSSVPTISSSLQTLTALSKSIMSAIQIAQIQEGRLSVDTGTLGIILDKAGDRPVVIVSVNGPLRSGKSYILNHFLRYLTASSPGEDWFHKALPVQFHWQNSSQRQTTGILAWSEPLVVLRQGREVAVLLLDTQGCFDDKTSALENSLIFAFSSLLSSVLVYNVKNQVSEDMLQFLHLFGGYARAVVDDPGSLSSLLLLVRDWMAPNDFRFGYYDDRGSDSDRNFKAEVLDGRQDMAPENLAVRRQIRDGFRDVACCLLPYPGNELAHHDKADNVEPMFVQAIQDLVPRIFSEDRGIVKRIGPHEATGPELKPIVQSWADLFSGAEMPPVQNVAEGTASVQNMMAAKAAITVYHTEMLGVVHGNDGLPEEQIWAIHAAKKQEALNTYNGTKRIRHEGIQQKYTQGLMDDLENAFGPYRDINTGKRTAREARVAAEAEARRIQEEAQRQIEAAKCNQGRRRRKWYKF